MGLCSIHRLCIVGSLGEEGLRSHQLLEVGREGRGACLKPYRMVSENLWPRNTRSGALLVEVLCWCECYHFTYWKNVLNAEHFPKCLLLSISL